MWERLMALVAYFDGGSDFVFEGLSPYGLATFARTGRIAGLDHKRLDVTMENAAIIIVGSTKGKKVLQHGVGVKG
jgi:hypothetical protein